MRDKDPLTIRHQDQQPTMIYDSTRTEGPRGFRIEVLSNAVFLFLFLECLRPSFSRKSSLAGSPDAL